VDQLFASDIGGLDISAFAAAAEAEALAPAPVLSPAERLETREAKTTSKYLFVSFLTPTL